MVDMVPQDVDDETRDMVQKGGGRSEYPVLFMGSSPDMIIFR